MERIQLSRGYVTLVDEEDFEAISEFNWFPDPRSHTVYVYRNKRVHERINGKKGKIYLHRQILGIYERSIHIDHINHDGLDNRRSNLRACTPMQNRGNSSYSRGLSKYKGVGWHKVRGLWRAYIGTREGKHVHLGNFETEEQAAVAYDVAARERWGEFAVLNFPDPNPGKSPSCNSERT